MADERHPDETFETAMQQQHAENHEPEADRPVPAEMLDSMRAHHETDAEQPVDEREHDHDTGPLRQDAATPASGT